MSRDFDSQRVRVALYYVPPAASAWWAIGCEWLALEGHSPAADGVWRLPLVTAPRRYGWHATLVAPFRCRAGVSLADVFEAAQGWAFHQQPFVTEVTPAHLDGFSALVPGGDPADSDPLMALARSAVEALAPFRAPLDDAERSRRLAGGLTPRQRELLEVWGYPYVMDQFRFHLTLTGPLAESDFRRVGQWWRARLPQLGPLPITEVALCVEPAPGEDFVVWRRLSLARPADPAGG